MSSLLRSLRRDFYGPHDPPPALEVSHLSKVYPGRRGAEDRLAVVDSSFTIRHGDSLGIVGESGSGKTTVAKMLLGLELPTSGQITIDGSLTTRRLNRDRLRRARQIQLVFQDPYSSLDPRQSVGDSLDEILRLHFDLGALGRRERIEELLTMVGFDPDAATLRPRRLSGGMRQRVAIAKALASEPSVVVLDEAVAALDISIQAQILNLLNRLRRETEIAFIFISHDLAVVAHISDQVQVMRNGLVVEEGKTADVLTSPKHPYTRALLGSVPRRGWKPSHSV